MVVDKSINSTVNLALVAGMMEEGGRGEKLYTHLICRQMVICYNGHTEYIKMYDFITVKSFTNH